MNKSSEKNLYLVRGLPSSGKTTLVESLKRSGDVSVAADEFMLDRKGIFFFDWRKLQFTHDRCRDTVKQAMKDSVERIFVHNTFKEKKEFESYFLLAEQYGYRIFSIIVEKRHDGEIVHGTPKKTIEKYRRIFEISL